MISLLNINQCAVIQNANTNKGGGRKTQETLTVFLEAFKIQTKIKIQHYTVCKEE